MELVEAIKGRRSIRGYNSTPVPQNIITEILDLARLSPSGVNTQPWEFLVLTGDSLERIKQLNVELVAAGAEPDPSVALHQLTGPYRERQIALAKETFRVMEIGREDRQKRMEWQLKAVRFFDAPAAIIICMDELMYNLQSPMPFLDLGIVTQSIALLAVKYGLGTCIEQAPLMYPQSIREALLIPSSKHLVIALAIGYPNGEFPANGLRTERENLDALVTWKS